MVLDPGLPNERTALAWQRTALSLMAGAAIVGRFTFGRLGYLALVGLAVAAILALWVIIESRRRYAHRLGRRAGPRPRGGRATLALTLALALIAVTELAALRNS